MENGPTEREEQTGKNLKAVQKNIITLIMLSVKLILKDGRSIRYPRLAQNIMATAIIPVKTNSRLISVN